MSDKRRQLDSHFAFNLLGYVVWLENMKEILHETDV